MRGCGSYKLNRYRGDVYLDRDGAGVMDLLRSLVVSAFLTTNQTDFLIEK